MAETRRHGTPSKGAPPDGLPAALLDGGAYDEAASKVELRETHISWVFLTDRHAYKVKKPVAFEFLDFGSLASREEDCRRELRLNRRLAPAIYLDVVPIVRRPSGRLQVGGAGVAVEWAVKMRRLDEQSCLQTLLVQRRLADHQAQQLSERLNRFYRQLPPQSVTPETYLTRLERWTRDNWRELERPQHELSSTLLERIHGTQLRALRIGRGWFEDRVRSGRVVDGHGDLRPEHIYFTPEPVAIDCLEFSDSLRAVDVVDELAFLAMECEHLGERHLGEQLLAEYSRTSGDQPPRRIVAFHKSYRAAVRAKVAALRAAQATGVDRERAQALVQAYLEQADAAARETMPPCLIIMQGVSGSGKSTVAGRLAATLHSRWLRTDELRRDIESTTGAQRRYEPLQRDRVYRVLLARCEDCLRERASVVLDGTFLRAAHRRAAVEAGRRWGALPLVVRCRCPLALAESRIRQRRQQAAADPSEAEPNLPAQQARDYESDSVPLPTVELDTRQDLAEMEGQILAVLARQLGEDGSNPLQRPT